MRKHLARAQPSPSVLRELYPALFYGELLLEIPIMVILIPVSLDIDGPAFDPGSEQTGTLSCRTA